MPNTAAPVLTIGEALIALVPSEPGPLEAVASFRPHVVGAELNTAVALARLNIPVDYAGCVGDDPWGRRIVQRLKAEGVGTRWVLASGDGPTPVMFKEWRGLDGEADVHYYRHASPTRMGAFRGEPLFAALAERPASWVHMSGINWVLGDGMAAVGDRLLQLAQAACIPVSFDVNLRNKLADASRWQAVLAKVLPHVDWVFASDDELRCVWAGPPVPSQEETDYWWERCHALGFGGRGLIIKQGAVGTTLVMADGRRLTAKAHAVSRVVDTVGAGDGFDAGFIAATLRGWAVEEALDLACLVGAFAVTTAGDNDAYPTMAQVGRGQRLERTAHR